jgi:Icc protein
LNLMPGIFYEPLDRRHFLRIASKATVALTFAVSGLSRAAEGGVGEAKAVRLALFSDTHIPADPKEEYRSFNPQTNLKAVAAQALESRPDGVIVNGDAARLAGEVADYEALQELLIPLAGQCPVYIGFGNHDSRENFEKVFSKRPEQLQAVTGKRVILVEHPAIRFLVLDSLLYTNKTAGLLGKAQRKWLESFLGSADTRPIVLFVHHTLGDDDGELLDAEVLLRIVQPHRKVKAIFYGHSHKYALSEADGLHLVNLPAVGYNFSDTEPVGWVDAQFTAKGVEWVLKVVGGNKGLDGQRKALVWRT